MLFLMIKTIVFLILKTVFYVVLLKRTESLSIMFSYCAVYLMYTKLQNFKYSTYLNIN